MFTTVMLRSLRDLRRSLLGWSLGTAALVLVMAAVWPTMRDMPDIEAFLASYPEVLRELFELDAMLSGAGFLNVELFSILLPAMFILFAIGHGARLIAGDEEAGSLEVVLATPLSRVEALLARAAALTAAAVLLGLVLFGAIVVTDVMVDMGIGAAAAANGALAMVLLGIEHGLLALAVGAATGRRVLALAASATVATAGYVLHVLSKLVDVLAPWQAMSPFAHALERGPLGPTFPPEYGWMVLVAVVVLAVAVPLFDRRDLRAA